MASANGDISKIHYALAIVDIAKMIARAQLYDDGIVWDWDEFILCKWRRALAGVIVSQGEAMLQMPHAERWPGNRPDVNYAVTTLKQLLNLLNNGVPYLSETVDARGDKYEIITARSDDVYFSVYKYYSVRQFTPVIRF